jgi:hypothetical protein
MRPGFPRPVEPGREALPLSEHFHSRGVAIAQTMMLTRNARSGTHQAMTQRIPAPAPNPRTPNSRARSVAFTTTYRQEPSSSARDGEEESLISAACGTGEADAAEIQGVAAQSA